VSLVPLMHFVKQEEEVLHPLPEAVEIVPVSPQL
jgi:hypothetical protein